MANVAVAKFETYDGKDFVLPQIFKDRVTTINNNNIVYNKFSAIIETSGSGTLNIYLPNQWFYIASYFTEFYNELSKYKKYALMVVDRERLKNLNGNTLSSSEEDTLKALDIDEKSKSYLQKFMTDYSWWGGAKTIDRGDFYVSPILSHARLVNASQSFVADLCAFLSDKDDLVKAIIAGEATEDYSIQTSSNTISRQVIYYGAPGTGKSHKIKEILAGQNIQKENIFRTTFHPDSDYSTFVGAYKPTRGKKPLYGLNGGITVRMKEGDRMLEEETITYNFIPQAFLNAYIRSYQTTDNVYLIIEEINRGNCAQIFGDLFQLLDRDEEGKSEYTIKADTDLKAYLEETLGTDNEGIKDGEICLPSNLYIYATMNTSDQSLFPIDSAFKRRWDWEYEPIKYKNTKWEIDIQDKRYSWVSFQKIVNDKIFDATHSEDKMLGDFFVNPGNQIISEKMLVNKILFYLWNDVCKDGESDIFKVNDSEDISFSQLYGEDGSRKLIDMMAYLKVAPFVADAGTGLEDSIIDDNEILDQSIKDWYKDIWDDVIDNIRNKVPGTLPSSAPRQNYQLSVGITGISAIAKISKQKNNCFIGYYIEKQQSSTLYPKLLAVKDLLEDRLGKLEWQYNEGHYGVAKISKSFSDLSDSEERDKLIEMISETLPEFYNAIIPLIEKLR